MLRPAVVEGVPHLIVAHNHPSGDPSPSPQDINVTKELAEAAKLLGLELLDHVVIGGEEAVSLKDRGPPRLTARTHRAPPEGVAIRGHPYREPAPPSFSPTHTKERES